MRVSGILYGIGALAVVAGAVTVGFGIPVKEFSFGNTLIAAGVTAAVGGLIVIALGAVIAQLQQLNDALAGRASVRQSRPFDTFDTAAAGNVPASGRIPFPPRPKANAELREPPAFEPHMDVASPPDLPAEEPPPAPSFAPMLRNPEEPPMTVEVDISLSPPHPIAAPARAPGGAPPPVEDETTPEEDYYEPKRDTDWRPPMPPVPPTRQPPGSYFDAMWPAEPKSAEPKPTEPKPAKTPADSDTEPMTEAAAPPDRHAESLAPIERPDSEPPRGVPILKSGVVDGMGYTLYVDGSIEAELPQGTLRFASINELRSHLEKNS